jgi:hypothetical protein
MMDTDPETDMVVRTTLEDDLLGIRKAPLVMVGGEQIEIDDIAAPDTLACELEVAEGRACVLRRRRLVPDELIEG